MGDEFTRINLSQADRFAPVLPRLHRYVTNRSLLFEHAVKTQRRMLQLCSPDSYARDTFGYLERFVLPLHPHLVLRRSLALQLELLGARGLPKQ